MLSVTQRIRSASQPTNGYVPISIFDIETYDDNQSILDVAPRLSSIQGLAVDYLTRFMLFQDKNKAFDISIRGAIYLDSINKTTCEYKNVTSLLTGIKGLDKESIINACKIVCYDSVLRAGIASYCPSSSIDFEESLYTNIFILVNRCLSFFKIIGPIIADELTFEGGYTKLVSSGDGDYMSKDTIIDIKVSKTAFSTKWSLQLLMYYLLGIHSIHPEFTDIKKLCIFNAYKNQSYICDISNISDESKYKVSQDILGYKMLISPYRSYSHWHLIGGSDPNAIRQFLTDNFSLTQFKIENYSDGIFDVTINDYWTYLTTTINEYKKILKPQFKNTVSVKLIKKNGYYMFISVSPKGKLSLLHGARTHSLCHPLEYYYDNIDKYCSAIIAHFSKYWDALKSISKHIQALEPSDQYMQATYAKYHSEPKDKCISSYNDWYETAMQWVKLSGKIHGCIVDIDFSNHIYLNPYDGTLVSYNARSMYDKKVYKNIRCLLSDQRPEMLLSYDNLIEQNNPESTLLLQDKEVKNELCSRQKDAINTKFIKVYKHDMYTLSNKLKPLQNIYDIKLVQIWYDEIINNDILDTKKILKEKRTRHHSDSKAQCCLRSDLLQKKKTRHHSDSKAAISEPKKSIKDKYMGLTKEMHCGLKATIIDYKDCNNLTIQFEDGLIKSEVRSDHFMNGYVRHAPNSIGS